MKKPNICLLYILVLATAFFGFDPKWGYGSGTPWWTHLTFHFAHGNIFHLAANMLVAFTVIFLRHDKWWLWPVCFVVATICSFIISTPKPTLGLSGILFAYYGIIFLKDGPQWKPLVTTLIYMAVSCLFASRMAIGLHCICLFIGALIGGFMGITNDIKHTRYVKENHSENP